MDTRQSYHLERLTDVHSSLLERDTLVDIFIPQAFETTTNRFPLLLLNDGQDGEAIDLKTCLEDLTRSNAIRQLVVVGVHAGDRLQEYGVAGRKDYKGRGAKAKNYTRFIMTELVPYLHYRYPISDERADHAIAGFSMGGLSAVDIAWNNAGYFGKVGAFSGSFWWRRRDAKSMFYADNRDRLMHQQIRKGKFKPGLKFWFQTGTLDEFGDRNKNGTIDSIDDTLDLIAELTKKGYRPFHDIQYCQIEGGRHNLETWKQAMPEFLKWAFGR